MLETLIDSMKVVSADMFSNVGFFAVITGFVTGKFIAPFLKKVADSFIIKYLVTNGKIDLAKEYVRKTILDNFQKFDDNVLDKLKKELPGTGQMVEDLFVNTFEELARITKE